MQVDINPCYKCKNFDRYYVKGSTKFKPVKFGLCYEKQETVCIHNTCEQWKQRPIFRRGNTLLKIRLNDLLTQISKVRNLVEEEQNVDKNL